jgi:hypothetical protein
MEDVIDCVWESVIQTSEDVDVGGDEKVHVLDGVKLKDCDGDIDVVKEKEN